MKPRKPKKNKRQKPPQSTGQSAPGLTVRRIADASGWVLVHPRCARDRAEDISEVRRMIEAGELEIAIDELRWLLSGCSEFLEAHRLLGELALQVGHDVPLARGHFGFAYQLGVAALRRAGNPSSLPYRQPANKSFFEAGLGLMWCLHQLKKPHMADEVIETLLQLDRTDPLQLRRALDELRSSGLPIVNLLREFPGQTRAGDSREV